MKSIFYLGILSMTACFGEKEQERKEGEVQGDCLDGEDNDNDGNIDCEDAGCSNKPACEETQDDDDLTTDTSTPDDDWVEDEQCGIEIDSTYPEVNQADMYVLQNIEVELSDRDDTATLTLQDVYGSNVPGELTVSDDTLIFDPYDPLLSSSTYTVILDYCGSDEPVTFSFSTSSLGEALENDVIENTYVIDISQGQIIEPAGVGDLIGGMIENYLLLSVQSISSTNISFLAGASNAGSFSQDFCVATTESNLSSAFSTTSPSFSIVQGEFPVIPISSGSLIASISGTFSTDGDYIGGIILETQLDAREMFDHLGDAGLDAETPADLCNLLLGFGLQCTTCSDGESYCIDFKVRDVTAFQSYDYLYPVCEQYCHEYCYNNTCNDPQESWEYCY